MTLYLQNTAHGLIPMYDTDYEAKRLLKIGHTYKVDIKLARNYEFHKKYFALIDCAWEFLNERQTKFFKQSKEIFRKTIEIAAGNCDVVYSIERKEWIEQAKSISFEKMDEYEFRELYERVKDVLFATALKNISSDDFMNQLSNF